MVPIKPALRDFPSDLVRLQFNKVFSGSCLIPTSPKIFELRMRHEEFNSDADKQEFKPTPIDQ